MDAGEQDMDVIVVRILLFSDSISLTGRSWKEKNGEVIRRLPGVGNLSHRT